MGKRNRLYTGVYDPFFINQEIDNREDLFGTVGNVYNKEESIMKN